MVDIPAISGVDDQANVRVVLLQGKQQVNAPLTALGFGTMANQNADSVDITGGAIKGISPLIVGHTAQLAIANTDNVQIIGTTVPAVGLGMLSFVNGGQPHVDFYSSPSGTIGTYAPVINGGALGAINWYGAQQTGVSANWIRGAQIRAQVEAAVTDGASPDMPVCIIFSTTPNGSGTMVERGRFTNDGVFDLSSGTSFGIKFGNANNSADTATLDGYTDWIAYTPTFTGFGTVSGVSIWSKRCGDTLHIRGKFTSGTSTGVEARMTLGFNGTNANVTSDATKVASIQLAGVLALSVTTGASYYTLIESNIGYITFGAQSATLAGLTKLVGTSVAASGNVVSFTAEIPITGW